MDVKAITPKEHPSASKFKLRDKFKGKDITKLSQTEKDELLIQIAKDLGYITNQSDAQ